MLRGLYTAGAGMISQQRRHDAVTNNIANLNTPGYKQANVVTRSFPEMLISLVNDGPTSAIGRFNTGVLAEESVMSFLSGALEQTDHPFDFAIVPSTDAAIDAKGNLIGPDGQTYEAFFTLMNGQEQERYTRDGKFTLQLNGDHYELVGSNGYRVLGIDGQPIQLPADIPHDQIYVAPDGSFYNMLRDGEALLDIYENPVRLLLSRINNPEQLVREGNGTFRLHESAEQPAVVEPELLQVRQGFIERSNVDPVTAMVDMMTAARLYEANQRVIQYYDRSLDKAVNEVGRV